MRLRYRTPTNCKPIAPFLNRKFDRKSRSLSRGCGFVLYLKQETYSKLYDLMTTGPTKSNIFMGIQFPSNYPKTIK
jgi:hypothetical protein